MIFVDTNVFMYSVERFPPLQRNWHVSFSWMRSASTFDCVHLLKFCRNWGYAYLPVNRQSTLEDAMKLIRKARIEVWPLEGTDVDLACQLHKLHPALSARDLCHLASCQRREVSRIETFDTALAAALN